MGFINQLITGGNHPAGGLMFKAVFCSWSLAIWSFSPEQSPKIWVFLGQKYGKPSGLRRLLILDTTKMLESLVKFQEFQLSSRNILFNLNFVVETNFFWNCHAHLISGPYCMYIDNFCSNDSILKGHELGVFGVQRPPNLSSFRHSSALFGATQRL